MKINKLTGTLSKNLPKILFPTYIFAFLQAYGPVNQHHHDPHHLFSSISTTSINTTAANPLSKSHALTVTAISSNTNKYANSSSSASAAATTVSSSNNASSNNNPSIQNEFSKLYKTREENHQRFSSFYNQDYDVLSSNLGKLSDLRKFWVTEVSEIRRAIDSFEKKRFISESSRKVDDEQIILDNQKKLYTLLDEVTKDQKNLDQNLAELEPFDSGRSAWIAKSIEYPKEEIIIGYIMPNTTYSIQMNENSTVASSASSTAPF